jgi:Trk K+ transport system NAD-binding subunit
MEKKKNILLFGYGNFGKQLYKHLMLANHNIRVLSTNDAFIQEAAEDNVNVEKINIKRNDDILALDIDEKKDLLYCAMNQTANNLFLVLTLRTLFPQATIIAISNSFENTRKLQYAGANSVIDLYEATSRRVVNILTKPAVTRALDEIVYKQNDLGMAEVAIEKGSSFDKVYINNIDFKAMGVILVAIIDKELGHELIFTDHRINHKLDVGDTLVVVSHKEKLKAFREIVNNRGKDFEQTT